SFRWSMSWFIFSEVMFFAAFFGVRRSADHAKDLSHLNPVHVVIAGIVAAVLFVVLLIVLVNWVLSSGVAT
ncbi:MAG TPA: DUF2970 domain-containing protein, partial [Albitalea sp.]